MATHKFTVERAALISPTTISVVLRNAKPSFPFSFKAGQYAALTFYRFGRPMPVRCFSIASSPTDPAEIEFGIRVNGAYTTALLELKKGSEVVIEGPFGGFVIDDQRDDRVVMLAGGIGITPLLSQVRNATRLQLPTKITLVYGNQSQDDVPYAAELSRLEQQNPNVKVLYTISRGATDKFPTAQVVSGRVTTEVLDQLPLIRGNQYKQNRYFICGPAGFMAGMTDLLEKKGVVADRIITEAFSQGAPKSGGSLTTLPKLVYVLSATSILAIGGALLVTDSNRILVKSQPAVTTLPAQTNSLNAGVPTTVAPTASQSATTPTASSSSKSTTKSTPTAVPKSTTTTPTTSVAPAATVTTPTQTSTTPVAQPTTNTYQMPMSHSS